MSENSQEWKRRQKANKHKNIEQIIPRDFTCPKCNYSNPSVDKLREHYKQTGH